MTRASIDTVASDEVLHSAEAARPRPDNYIPFHRPSLGVAEEQEVLDTLRSGWLTTGPKTQRFEQLFADYCRVEHAVGVSSGTAALHLCLVALDVGLGDEVITSPMTFAATANVIEHVGARPVFVDVEADTLNMDPKRLAAAITGKTKVIIPVHFAGHPCDMGAIMELADRRGISVIEDAAHAIESWHRDRKVGGIGTATCFSFYATKNITTGEGGMITTNDDELARRLRTLRLHGISVDAWQRYEPGQYRHWDILEPGLKYNMFDIQASMGIHQIAKVDDLLERRRRWCEMYDAGFADIPELITLKRRDDARCAYHLYAVRFAIECLRVDRDELIQLIQDRGIGVGVHFRPIHLHPYYRDKYGFKEGDFPAAEYAGQRLISLPLYPDLAEQQVQHVINEVRELVVSQRRDSA